MNVHSSEGTAITVMPKLKVTLHVHFWSAISQYFLLVLAGKSTYDYAVWLRKKLA